MTKLLLKLFVKNYDNGTDPVVRSKVGKTDENGKVSKDYAGSGFYWSTFLGAHYYLNKTFGFVLEFGHPVWVKTGISLKF